MGDEPDRWPGGLFFQKHPVQAHLFELRRIDAPIDYKAVLTPTNAGWTIPRLLMEMHSEKAAYTAKNR